MNATDIKKELYKQKPIADYGYEYEGYKFYTAKFKRADNDMETVRFKIPVNECQFENEVPAQLLIRWMQ